MDEMKKTIQQILAGDKSKFELIIREFSPGIRSYIAGKTGNPQIVDDLTQEIFIAVYTNLHQFDLSKNFAYWVNGITRNQVNMYFRKYYSQKSLKDKLRMDILGDIEQDYETAFQKNLDNALDRMKFCMEKLPEKLKETVSLKYLNNLKAREIAEKINSSVTAVTTNLQRARKLLKTCINTD